MHKNYYLELIVEKPELFAVLARFNSLTADHLNAAFGHNETLWAALPPELWETLLAHGPSCRHLESSDTTRPQPFWDFSEPSRCLALLDTATLDELTLFYGASLHAQEIARTIMGKDMVLLREHLGKRVHEYALHRGQYQTPWGRKIFLGRHHVLPLAQRARLHGQEALGLLLSTWPAALQSRVPARMREAPAAELPSSPEVHQGIWFDMKRLLLKEVAPTWQPCFA